MANTTWNPSDKGAAVSLSGGNLIASWLGGRGAVRSIQSQTTGKYYWECKFNIIFGVGAGIATSSANITTPGGAAMAITNTNGLVYVNQWTTSACSIGAFADNDVCCIAMDAGAQLIWFRKNASGQWNGSGTADPATGVGGVSFSSIGTPAYAVGYGYDSSGQITANFGDSAFTGTVPAGFTSGFTTTPTNMQATQLAAEQWLATNPSLQSTQVLLEQWITVATDNPQMIVTQALIEQWISVAVASTAQQARVMVMA